jgi:hypothetical protein
MRVAMSNARFSFALSLALVATALIACGGEVADPAPPSSSAVDATPSMPATTPATTTSPPATTTAPLAATPPPAGKPEFRQVGEACSLGSQCASGGCSADFAAGSCGQCLDVRRLGESCGGALQGCSPSAVCQGGVCVSTKKVAGEVCRLEPKGGDAGDCDDALFCTGKPGDENGRCAVRLAVGAACTSQYPAVPCVKDAVCDQGTCTPVHPLVAGDSCGPLRCPDAFFCEETTQTCQPATLPKGNLCGIVDGSFVNNECVAGTLCGDLNWPNGGGGDETVETCVALPTAGQVCLFESCAAGLFCHVTEESGDNLAYRCEPLHLEGEACALTYPTIDCAAGLECRSNVCAKACH